MRCCFLQSVKRVIGVEIIENAVEDAKANAQLNGEFKRLVFSCHVIQLVKE